MPQDLADLEAVELRMCWGQGSVPELLDKSRSIPSAEVVLGGEGLGDDGKTSCPSEHNEPDSYPTRRK